MNKHDLALELYRHCDDLERYAAYIADVSVGDFEETNEKIFNLIYQIAGEKIANNFKSEQKLKEFREKVAEIRTDAANSVLELLKKESEDTILVESAFLFAFFSALAGTKAKNISVETVENIAKYGRYRGLSQKEIIKKVLSGDIQRIFEAVSIGLENNLSAKELLDSVKKEFANTRRFLRSEIDVIVNGLANDTALSFASKNEIYLVWSSMMDDRVCPACDRDGDIWRYDDPDIPSLPAHINCRCRFIPWGGEDDFDVKDFNISFAEYFNSLDKAEQRRRIGNAKYKGYLNGTEKINKFIEPPASAFLTIEQLAERDSAFILKG